MQADRRLFAALGTASLVIGVCTGCAGGIHRHGQHQFAVTASGGHPIKGEAIWPEGEGRAENAGVSLGYSYYAADRLALMVVGSPLRQYRQTDGNVWAAELEIGLRYHFWEFSIGDVPIGFHVEALGGLLTGSMSVPEDGAHTNFTQGTGLGFEVQFSDHVSWVGGYRLRHLSHGHVWTGGENPGQNDHHVYTGIAITW